MNINRVSQIAFSITIALLSGGAYASNVEHGESENINGIPAESLARFAYPDLPLLDALSILRSDYYGNPDSMALLQHQYEASLDKSELDEKLEASSLPNALKEDMKTNPYLKAYYFQPRSSKLTQTKYKDVPLFWNVLPVKEAKAAGRVVGKVDAMSVLDNLGGFDLDLISQAQAGKPGVGAIDYLVVADYGLCGITSSLAARCRGVGKGTPMPMIYYNMLSDPISPRQQAMPPAPTSNVTPRNALGLYEQAQYYKRSVNPKAKLLLSISADLRKVPDLWTTAKAIVTYMNTWGYDGVIFDRPDFSPTEEESATTYNLITELKLQDHDKIVGIQLYGSHQFEDWDKQGLLKLQETVDFMTVSLNHYLDDDEIGQDTPVMNVYGSHGDSYNANYERLLGRLFSWGVDTRKLMTTIESEWRVRHYSDYSTNWWGQVSGTADTGSESPGTFDYGKYYFYDFDQMLNKWNQVSGLLTLSDYYIKPEDKLIATGNDRMIASDKVVFSSSFNVAGTMVRLDQDNGRLTAGIIDGMNLQTEKDMTFSGKQIDIQDNGQYQHLWNQQKYNIVDTGNGITSTVGAPVWGPGNGYVNNGPSTITVPVLDDNLHPYEFKLLIWKKTSDGRSKAINQVDSMEPYGFGRANIRHKISETIYLTAGDNSSLPAGHYKSINPVIIKTKGWHQTYNYGNRNQVFRTINVNIDVNQ
ncbi:hypothetical protein V0242_09130 [Aeromonas hydrophila]|uniref:hypothetical protein n=1 Tax=Aeromonas hydrophila TaxID=644 RepID=UPI002ED4E795|nr:hypothetical protein V0242_09130 [Aeromonas hydrophila]